MPGAPIVARHVREASRKPKLFGGVVKAEEVARVSRLYPAAREDNARGAVTLVAAKSASRDYVRYYMHALPFSPDSLIDLWKRCQSPPHEPGGCGKGLAEARDLVRYGVKPRSPRSGLLGSPGG
jgi:hypothetical protein